MTAPRIPIPTIYNAVREVCLALEGMHHQSSSWTCMTEDELWRELVACILGSRVRYEVAYSAVKRMDKWGLLTENRRSSCFQQYEDDIKEALSNESILRESSRYPFYRIRANQIRRAAEWFYGSGVSLRTFLENSPDIRNTRRNLALEVSGLGPKQASLFLRNTGYSENVAVLDVHVLTYMSLVGLIETPMKQISSVRMYETLENAFIEHAYTFGYTPDHFDLAVWVVMKVAKEQKTWE